MQKTAVIRPSYQNMGHWGLTTMTKQQRTASDKILTFLFSTPHRVKSVILRSKLSSLGSFRSCLMEQAKSASGLTARSSANRGAPLNPIGFFSFAVMMSPRLDPCEANEHWMSVTVDHWRWETEKRKKIENGEYAHSRCKVLIRFWRAIQIKFKCRQVVNLNAMVLLGCLAGRLCFNIGKAKLTWFMGSDGLAAYRRSLALGPVEEAVEKEQSREMIIGMESIGLIWLSNWIMMQFLDWYN